MSNFQVDVMTWQKEVAVAQPTNIKIRFKKGAVFGKGDEMDAGNNSMGTHLTIRLSPKSGKKRKAEKNADGVAVEEHDVKRIKTMEANKDDNNDTVEGDVTNSIEHVVKNATSPCDDINKKTPNQAASIFRNLAIKLRHQPLLLQRLKEYRTSINLQHRGDTVTIAKLQAQLSTMTKEAGEKDLRAAENIKASEDMLSFWMNSFHEEVEGFLFLRQKVLNIASKVEALNRAAVTGDINSGMDIEVGLKKLAVELTNLGSGRK